MASNVLSKEELATIRNTAPAQPKNQKKQQEKNSVSSNLKNRFKADEYKGNFEKLDEYLGQAFCVMDVTINNATGKDGSQFKAVSITCIDLDGNEHELSSTASQVVNMLKAMQEEHYQNEPVFPCWMIAKKSKTTSGRLATLIDFTDKDYPIPGSIDEAFGKPGDSEVDFS